MRPSGGGKLRLTFLAPTRGLIGYHGEFLTDTRGTGVMSRLFHGYAPYKGSIEGRRNGVLISTARGRRGRLCAVEPRRARADVHRARDADVYAGHDHRRAHAAATTSTSTRSRASSSPTSAPPSKDEAVRLTPPVPDDASSRRSPISATTSWSR